MFLCGLFLLVAVALPAVADTCIKQVTTTDAFEIMGQKQPGRSDTSITWLGNGMARMDGPNNTSTIFRVDKGMLYVLDNNAKTYSEMPIEALGDIKKMAGIKEGEEGAAEAEAAQKMAQAMMGSMKVTVTPTTETKAIKDWKATKYLVDMSMPMGATKTEIWASEDVKVDYSLFQTVSNGMMAQLPSFAEMLKEMQKVKGLPVLSVSEVEMMKTKVKSTTELLECSEKAAPTGLFDVPAGYKKAEMSHKPGSK
jgi:hypothetical protein